MKAKTFGRPKRGAVVSRAGRAIEKWDVVVLIQQKKKKGSCQIGAEPRYCEPAHCWRKAAVSR